MGNAGPRSTLAQWRSSGIGLGPCHALVTWTKEERKEERGANMYSWAHTWTMLYRIALILGTGGITHYTTCAINIVVGIVETAQEA